MSRGPFGVHPRLNSGSSGGASALDDLTDVTLTSPADGDMLTYETSTSKWKNKALAILKSLVTTKGDLIAATGSAAPARLPVGTDGQVLTADSGATPGVSWQTPSGGGGLLTTKGDLFGHSTVDARVPVGSDGQVLTADSTQTLGVKWAAGGGGSAPDYILIRDEKSSGTNAGSFSSGAWRTRDLNTEVVDTGSHASVASNQITLDAGTYVVHASATAIGVDAHQIRLYNTTDSAELVLGANAHAQASVAAGTTAQLVGRFTIASSKVIELQHRCVTTNGNTYGRGISGGWGTEVYAVVEIEKVA